jgi:very-short-patch-repair endonuclease
MRQSQTNAESALWSEPRARRLGGHKFRRQWTLGPYIADFCCLESRLIVEADGGQHTPEADRARTDYLRGKGFRILRFWNNDILANMEGVLTTVLEALGGPGKEEDPHHEPPLTTVRGTVQAAHPLPRAGEGA